jgi:hypothetical protein
LNIIIIIGILLLVIVFIRKADRKHKSEGKKTDEMWFQWFPNGSSVRILNGKKGKQIGLMRSEDAYFVVSRMLLLGLNNDFFFDKNNVDVFIQDEHPNNVVKEFLLKALESHSDFVFHWEK